MPETTAGAAAGSPERGHVRQLEGLRFVRASGTTSAERWAVESVMSVMQVSSSRPVESVTDDETDDEPVEVLL